MKSSSEPGSSTYLSNLDRWRFERLFKAQHRLFADVLDFDRVGTDKALAELLSSRNEFETNSGGGRGESYRDAQCATTARLTGIETLLQMLTGDRDLRRLPTELRLLDVLGGDGLLSRALRTLAPRLPAMPLLTSDVAKHMIDAALGQGLPAIRQAANFFFLRESSFDGVLVAYGSHHIHDADRKSTCEEAFRILRPGGRIVLHDFEEGSPVAEWFAQVVHPLAESGHSYRHFTRAEMHSLLKGAGFANIVITDMYDPIRLCGPSEGKAIRALLGYLNSMYGLRLDKDGHIKVHDWLIENIRYDYTAIPNRLESWCSGLTIVPSVGKVVAELPRLALVATATRPVGA